MGILYAVVRASYMAVVTDDVWNVTKRKPRSFEDFVKDNIACWE
jgi:hypothetical protein